MTAGVRSYRDPQGIQPISDLSIGLSVFQTLKPFPINRFRRRIFRALGDRRLGVRFEIAVRQALDPIGYDGTADNALRKLNAVLAVIPGLKIDRETETDLHAQAISFVFRVRDDVELVIDTEARVIHFRSASRAGIPISVRIERGWKRSAKRFYDDE